MVKPFVGSSALAGRDDSAERSKGNLTALIDISSTVQPEEQKGAEKKKPQNLNQSMDGNDSISRGGGIASKIGLAMSRIVQSGQNERLEDDEEIRDLINLIEDLNSHSDLTEKLTNQSKISLFLQKAGDPEKGKPTAQKNYKEEIGNAKNKFGMFQSKLRLEMKALMFDPRVKEIVDASRLNLEKL